MGLAGFCFVLILYLNTSRVSIVIHPNTQKTDENYNFTVTDGGQNDYANGILAGKIITVELEDEKVFPVNGTKVVSGASDIVGEVVITNTTAKDQALVATTRLAKADDPKKVLVRIKNDVVVKANSSAKVKVYAETPEAFQEIEPTKMIIPGLWQGLWDKIYAQNEKTLAVGAVTVGVLSEQDLAEAENSLKESIYQIGSEQIVSVLNDSQLQWVRITGSEIVERSSDVTVGQEVSEFKYKIKLKVFSVLVDENSVIDAIKEKIKANSVQGKKVSDFDPQGIKYSLVNATAQEGKAEINISFSVDSLMSGSQELFDKTNLVGKSKKEIIDHFAQFAEVESVDVSFQPVWSKVSPNNPDKISIRMAQ